MMTGLDHLAALYVLCGGTQDDLQHDLPLSACPATPLALNNLFALKQVGFLVNILFQDKINAISIFLV